MKRYILLAILCLFTTSATAQVKITVDDDPVVGRLVVLSADVDIVVDDAGLPSHTIEWDSDDDLMEFAIQPNLNTLILPTGCVPKKLTVKIRVIDWENRRIDTDRLTFSIVASDGAPPVIDPPTDPPADKWGDLEATATAEFKKIDDPETAKILADNWDIAIRGFSNVVTIADAKQMISDARAATFRGLAEQPKNWNSALLAVSKAMGDANPTTIEEYAGAMLAIVAGLRAAN